MSEHINKVVTALDSLIQDIINDGRETDVIVVVVRDGERYLRVETAPKDCINSHRAVRLLDTAARAVAESIIPERLKN